MSDIFETLIPTGNEETIDITKNYAEELIGEGKKYADIENASRAIVEKELHIRKIERENAALRTTSAAQQKLEDLVTKLSTLQAPSPTKAEEPDNRDQIVQTPEKIEETVLSLLAKRDAESRQAVNVRRAGEALLKQFGPNYNVHLNTVAAQLGMPRANLDNLAAQSPEAFLKLVGVEQKDADQAINPPQSAVTTQVRPAAKGEKTRSYYNNLLKTNRSLFLSPAVQNEMHEQAFKLGAAFDT